MDIQYAAYFFLVDQFSVFPPKKQDSKLAIECDVVACSVVRKIIYLEKIDTS